ncbi:MAG: hypothetical protein SCAL_001430 [Candidatus Syntrophoarchaeum caldarius]|uniref:Uncharacterized protein n=1 Tax=Candidatus Syntropharchaeum caldarium TaxID=1838285 RepID=A0A1F2P947_9EURY|nr:MAG: hypothetical protein SCAL_001430 [Candidatus Syntrophoarchaeum caldarius]
MTDEKAGTIKVYSEKGELLTDKTNLSEVVVKLIEKNFFDTVGIKLSELGEPLNPAMEKAVKECHGCSLSTQATESKETTKKQSFKEPDPMFA